MSHRKTREREPERRLQLSLTACSAGAIYRSQEIKKRNRLSSPRNCFSPPNVVDEESRYSLWLCLVPGLSKTDAFPPVTRSSVPCYGSLCLKCSCVDLGKRLTYEVRGSPSRWMEQHLSRGHQTVSVLFQKPEYLMGYSGQQAGFYCANPKRSLNWQQLFWGMSLCKKTDLNA